ncbi:MAG: hypothetical protein AAF633_11625 [Chloroflexota bacterium]
MPVLARLLEKAGIPTILLSMMPFYAEIGGAPRTLAVEFPFIGVMSTQLKEQVNEIMVRLHQLAVKLNLSSRADWVTYYKQHLE